jgi:NAD dependent epimerase/dehydratase
MILVTGADGFIGSHLVEHLVLKGHKVRAFALYNSFGSWGWLDTLPPEVLDSIEVFSGDVRDPNGVRTAVQGCQTIYHLAALIGIPYSYHSPDTYVDTNIKGTLNILQAARDLGVEKVVQTSTSEVYGTAQTVPITESHPVVGQSPYSATKIAADQLALSYFYSFETPVAIARPFNTYGPRQSARAVIPTIITQLASGQSVIKMGDTSPTRDFNFVSDTVKGFCAIANSDKAIGEAINIGSNHEISIFDLVTLIGDIMGVPVQIETDTARIRPEKSEVQRLLASNSKALEIIGWSPQYSGRDGLRRGLSETVDWFTDPVNLSRYKAGIYNI